MNGCSNGTNADAVIDTRNAGIVPDLQPSWISWYLPPPSIERGKAMKTLSTCFLRSSAEALGYQLIKRYRGCYDLRDDERLYLKNAPRTWIARFLLECATERLKSSAACEFCGDAAE
jgi:hypothetical protein